MEQLFKSITNVQELKLQNDDSYVDRLSNRYTVCILISFACLVTTKQFVGSPIHCWCPAQFTDSHIEYTNALCWVRNTYYLPIEKPIPGKPFSRDTEICYYQWVPLLLIFQSILTFLPCQLWRFLSQRSGVNLSSVVDAAKLTGTTSFMEVREKAIRFIVNHMDHYLLAQRDYRTGCFSLVKRFLSKICCCIGGRDYGNYLVTSYIVVKVIYLINAFIQISLIAALVGEDYWLYGLEVIYRILCHYELGEMRHFPRVTLCEFEIRDQSRVHSYIVQCTLSINLFNEKIFIFLWFWFVTLSIVTFIDILRWVFKVLYWPGQVQFVRQRLRAFDVCHRESVVLARFTENYLRRDGLLIVRLIAVNSGDMAAGEVLCGLWNHYSPERRVLAESGTARKRSTTVNQRGSTHLDMYPND